MIKKLLISFMPIAAMVILTSSIMSDNGKAGRTGSPGETNCTNCHNSFANNSGGGSITISSPGMTSNEYTPGQTYSMSVTISKAGINLFGVGIEALTSTNANAGTLIITDAASTSIKNATVGGVSRRNIVHKKNGGIGTGSKVFNFNWTAPLVGTGNVTFYFSGIAANGNGSDANDYVYTSSQVYTESSSCTGIPLHPGSISGNTTTCSGVSLIYSVAPSSDSLTYTWTLPSGWTGTSTSNSISVIAGSSSGTISVTAGNPCGISPAATLPVSITTLTANITASGNVLYASSGTTHEWYLNGNLIVGATDTIYIPVQDGNYVVVISSNGCEASSAPFPFIVPTCSTAPLQPLTINGYTTTCSGSVIIYSTIQDTIATSYLWNLPSGWTGSSTTNSITVATGNISGLISVVAVNNCGNSPATSLPVTIAAPVIPTISANGNLLQASAGDSYQWFFNGNSIAGATNSDYTATQSGSYVVNVTDNGCQVSSAPYVYSTSSCTSAPAQPGVISGNQTPCSGSTETYSISNVSNALSYSWILPNGWIGSSTSNSVTVTTGTDPGSIIVVAVNACGSSPATNLQVSINDVIAAITYSNHVLHASQGTSHQWYLNGNLIQGATNSSYTPLQIGDYSVVVFNNNCSGSSAPYYVGMVGLDNIDESHYHISVFPNPSSDRIIIDVPDELTNSNLLIYNISGQIVYQSILKSRKTFLDVSEFSEGVYSAIATKENYKSVKRILISR